MKKIVVLGKLLRKLSSLILKQEAMVMINNKTIYLILALLIGSLSAGCYTTPNIGNESQGSNLTVGMVKTQVIKGETNQAEILEIFGAPNIITKNRDNDEVWNYNRMSFDTASSSGGILAIFWTGNVAGAGSASKAASTATTKSFDLILIFDENDVVIDYSVIAASY